jgi:branched-chain amino acid transport system substrate-binding protein
VVKQILLAAACAIGTLLLPGAGSAEETIKLGIIFPLSGGSGPQGQNTVKAVRSMTDMINEKGGVLGKQVELLVRDDESTPAIGVAKANELVSAGVSAVIEGWNSPVSLAMQPIFNRANIFDLTANAQADQILSGKGNPLAVRLNSATYLNGAATARLIQRMGWKRLALLVQSDVFGKDARDALVESLKKLGVNYEIVVQEEFPMSQLDFRGPFTSIVDANPDVIIFWNANTGAGVPTTIRTYAQMGIKAPLVGGSGVIYDSTIADLGNVADGVRGTDFYLANKAPFDQIPENVAFVNRVMKDHGMMPDKSMALAAMAVQVWAKVANEVGTLDKTTIATRIRGKIVKGTIVGDASFDENGQLLATFHDWIAKGGQVSFTD